MKITGLILVSLLANLVLFGAVVHYRQGASASRDSTALNADPATNGVAAAKTKKTAKKRPATLVSESVAQTTPEKFTWAAVEAADYKQYIANLRAIECPEETIRDIITADVEKMYTARKKALHLSNFTGKFWEQKQWWEQDNSTWKKDRELDKEKRNLLMELLGVDPQKERIKLFGGTDYNEKMYPFLSAEKREQALELHQKYQDLEQEVQRKYRGYWGEETYAELKEVRARRNAELAQLLTPQELEEFNLRNSNIANQMGWEVRQFDPSEQEYRALYKIKETFEEMAGNVGPDPDDKEAQKKWADARKVMNDEIKNTLGDGRYKEYERSQDYQFQQLSRMADRQGLPKETAGKIYDMKDAAEAEAAKVRADQSLSADQRRDALKAIQTETEKSATELLGEKTFKNYRSRYGYWLRSFGR